MIQNLNFSFLKNERTKAYAPLFIGAILFFSSIIAVAFQIPQDILLWALLIFYFFMVSISPGNAVLFFLIILPCCLGNSKRPYFFYLEWLIFFSMLSGLTHYVFGMFRHLKTNSCILKKEFAGKGFREFFGYLNTLVRKKNVPVYMIFFGGALILAFLNIPVNLKELYYFMKGSPVALQWSLFTSANEQYDIYFLRSLFNGCTAILLGIFVSVFLNKAYLENLFKMIVIILGVSSCIALGLRFDWIPHPVPWGAYLTLQLGGQLGIGNGMTALTGFAYNSGYWGQYLVITLPFAGAFLCLKKQYPRFFWFALFSFILGIITIPLIYQRGPVIAIVGELMVLGGIWIYSSKNSKRTLSFFIMILTAIIATLMLVDFFFVQNQGLERLLQIAKNPSLRNKVWLVAFKMFTHNPLLGIGLGKFHYYFPQYCQIAGIPWEGHIVYVRTTAHNVYLHILAEQGILGIAGFLGLLSFFFFQSLKALKEQEPVFRVFLIMILISLTGWLFFGLSQNMFYLRIMQLYFWISLGILTLFWNKRSEKKIGLLKTASFAALIFVALLIPRVYLIWKFIPCNG